MSSGPTARDRVVSTAHDLFRAHGVQPIGVDRIVAEAGVTKTTLYRHFRSKEELTLATLDLREQMWTTGWLVAEVEDRGGTAEERLLAIFDVLDDWFRRPDYESCFFTNTLLEFRGGDSPIPRAAADKLANVRAFVQALAEEAGVSEPTAFAEKWQLLMAGAYVAALEGRRQIASLAREAGATLLDEERRARG